MLLSQHEINKMLSTCKLDEINKCLKCYGFIIKDINVNSTNKRYTTIKYKNYFFKIVMQHGEVLSIEKSKFEIQLF